MLTTTARASPASSQRSHSRSVETSTPFWALTIISAQSLARIAVSESARNDDSPGASIRLISVPRHSRWHSDAEMLIPRRCSSSSKSLTVDPSATLPMRLVSPAANNKASTRLVFPVPRCPSTATLRILEGSWWAMSCLSLRGFQGADITQRASSPRAENHLGKPARTVGAGAEPRDLPQANRYRS